MVITPEQSAAYEITRMLQFPSAINIESFAKGRVEVIEIKIVGEEPIVGIPLHKLPARIATPILIGAVERQDAVIIPDGNFVVTAGDTIYIVGKTVNAYSFCKAIGKCALRIRNVMIVGGGRIAYYLSRMLLDSGMKIKIIEINEQRCLELSELLPEALIIQGDGTDEELLASENLSDMDALVAMTGRDEENLILAAIAR
jgi:trk system potassium uptake protein TrkA